MNGYGFVGTKIVPMRDFWVDCYTTAMYSIYLSHCNADKNEIYENNYEYIFNVNEEKQLGRIYVKTYTEDLVNKLLTEDEQVDFVHDEHFVDSMKKYFDAGKLIMLGIDMFYGVDDTSQWHRHHIRHYILVEGYNEETKEFFLMETGDKGYMEYRMSYEELEKAAKGFHKMSYVYTVNKDCVGKMYDIEKVKSNAKRIVSSIDNTISHLGDIWNVEEKYILSMRDEIDTHIKSMANRQYANSILFNIGEFKTIFPTYSTTFRKLEMKFYNLRKYIIDTCSNGQYYHVEIAVKKMFSELLLEEKALWDGVIAYSEAEALLA